MIYKKGGGEVHPLFFRSWEVSSSIRTGATHQTGTGSHTMLPESSSRECSCKECPQPQPIWWTQLLEKLWRMGSESLQKFLVERGFQSPHSHELPLRGLIPLMRAYHRQVDFLPWLCWNCSPPARTELMCCTFYRPCITCLSFGSPGTCGKSHPQHLPPQEPLLEEARNLGGASGLSYLQPNVNTW